MPTKAVERLQDRAIISFGFLLRFVFLNVAKIHQKQETTKENTSINKRLTLQCVGIPEKVVSLQSWNVGLRERVIDVLIFTANVSTFGLRKSGITSQLSRCGVCPLTSSQGVFALHLVVVLEWFKSATIGWRAFSFGCAHFWAVYPWLTKESFLWSGILAARWLKC